MSNFPEFDHASHSQARQPGPERDWLVFGLAAGCLILAGISICLAIATWRRYTPKVITKKVEVVVEKEVPIEVVKEVEKIVKPVGYDKTRGDFGFGPNPLPTTEDRILKCFYAVDGIPALKPVDTGGPSNHIWDDKDAGVSVTFIRNDAGVLVGLEFMTHIASFFDAKIEGTRDNRRLKQFVAALLQSVKEVNPGVEAFLPDWSLTTLLQPNSFAHCDMLDTRVSTMTTFLDKNGGMILFGCIGTDPEHDSGKPK